MLEQEKRLCLYFGKVTTHTSKSEAQTHYIWNDYSPQFIKNPAAQSADRRPMKSDGLFRQLTLLFGEHIIVKEDTVMF